MEISLDKPIMEAVGPAALTPYGGSEDKIRYRDDLVIDLSNHTRAAALKLKEILSAHAAVRGVKSRVDAIDRWVAVLDGEKVKVRKVKDFESMLKRHLKDAPRHWVYQRRDGSESWQPYYVGDIAFHPRKVHYGDVTPAHVTMKVYWEELGEIHASADTFWAPDCEGMTVSKALAQKGYVTESPDLYAAHRAAVARYADIWDKVGLQFTATGTATDDVDSATKDGNRSWWGKSTIRLDRDGEPAHLVIDVRYETDKRDRDKDKRPDPAFWGPDRCDHAGADTDDDNDIKPGDEDEDAPPPEIDVPLCPALVMFDLRRQVRLRVYADQITPYVYQTDLGRKLILPPQVTDLVDMLVSRRVGFTDIVGNKGGGAIVLCAGPPGTGKTLTAEVYSEAMSRPLYSVQCSQLGTKPDDLEEQLRIVFARAHRWNAILLLDEADVYVAARGADLIQNAIVGVFLRTLEYYAGVMFLTTNRFDLVDDAVASRCLARIDYGVPPPDDQKRIWRTLADTAGVAMTEAEISKTVKRFPRLSGRDVKNLLKLGAMVAAARGEPAVTADLIAFVKQFKPTADHPEER